MNRRKLLLTSVAFALFSPALTGMAGAVLADPIDVTVYKDPACGCCKLWVEHLRTHRFEVTVHETGDMDPVKKQFAIPEALQACHTATIGGYVIEGHVPARDISRLLNERPKARGLAAPGMPAGSPGMETEALAEHYDVLLFADSGDPKIFSSY